jgi:hypothetical protein
MAGTGAEGFMVDRAAAPATAAEGVRAVAEDPMVGEAEERVPPAPVREAAVEGDRITDVVAAFRFLPACAEKQILRPAYPIAH